MLSLVPGTGPSLLTYPYLRRPPYTCKRLGALGTLGTLGTVVAQQRNHGIAWMSRFGGEKGVFVPQTRRTQSPDPWWRRDHPCAIVNDVIAVSSTNTHTHTHTRMYSAHTTKGPLAKAKRKKERKKKTTATSQRLFHIESNTLTMQRSQSQIRSRQTSLTNRKEKKRRFL